MGWKESLGWRVHTSYVLLTHVVFMYWVIISNHILHLDLFFIGKDLTRDVK